LYTGTGVEGTADYCERYGENISKICQEMDDTKVRPMHGTPTVQVIHDAMRKAVPAEELGARRQWRDDRLAALFLHKQEQKRKDEGHAATVVKPTAPAAAASAVVSNGKKVAIIGSGLIGRCWCVHHHFPTPHPATFWWLVAGSV
jgi:hypothetical protein